MDVFWLDFENILRDHDQVRELARLDGAYFLFPAQKGRPRLPSQSADSHLTERKASNLNSSHRNVFCEGGGL
jgi:hypothetical protein